MVVEVEVKEGASRAAEPTTPTNAERVRAASAPFLRVSFSQMR